MFVKISVNGKPMEVEPTASPWKACSPRSTVKREYTAVAVNREITPQERATRRP